MNKLITKFKLNRTANARKWKHLFGGIIEPYNLVTSSYTFNPIRRYYPKPNFGSNDVVFSLPERFYTTSSNDASPLLNLDKYSIPGEVVLETTTLSEVPISESDLNKSISQILSEEGISHKVTSSYRPGDHTTKGRKSNHSKKDSLGNPMAYDIVPTDGNFVSFRLKIYSNPRVMSWLKAKHWGILEETDPRGGYIDQNGKFKYTRATGPHFHFGPDGFLKE